MAEDQQVTTETASEEKAKSNPSRKTNATKAKPKQAWVITRHFKEQTRIVGVCLDEATLNKEFPTLVKKNGEYSDSDGANGMFASLVEVH